MTERGHASPIDTPSICVRDDGQIGARDSIKKFQNVGKRTIGTEDACVLGCESR